MCISIGNRMENTYLGMCKYLPYLQVDMEWQPWLDKLPALCSQPWPKPKLGIRVNNNDKLYPSASEASREVANFPAEHLSSKW